jgi:hypothetical protein
MICSKRELGLGSENDAPGIWILDDKFEVGKELFSQI